MKEHMDSREIEQVRFWVWDNLRQAIDNEYAVHITENNDFIYSVCDDVELTSGWEKENLFNETDVRIALGRVLCDNLGIDY